MTPSRPTRDLFKQPKGVVVQVLVDSRYESSPRIMRSSPMANWASMSKIARFRLPAPSHTDRPMTVARPYISDGVYDSARW